MSRASLLVRHLEGLGIELRLVGTKIGCRPADRLSVADSARIQLCRAALILELEARSDPLTAEVIAMFDGEVVPESQRGETVPLDCSKPKVKP